MTINNMLTSPMDNLPTDIINNILARLPVKPLLRLKTVCKSWLAIITSAGFADLHLLHHSSNRLLIASDKSSNLYLIDLDSSDCGAVKLEQPIQFPALVNPNIVGSCNGILCLRYVTSTSEQESVLLLNPCTQEYKVLGERGFPFTNYYGFGYDSGNNEHKLVQLSCHCKTLVPKEFCGSCITRVYSLKTNNWSLIDDDGLKSPNFRCHFCSGYDGGALIRKHLLHWNFRSLCPERFPDTIGCFDICENKWKAMAPPNFEEMDENNSRHRSGVYVPKLLTLGVLDECLCLVTNNRVRSDVYDVWVMKEYGVSETWVKLLGVADSVVTVYESNTPIAWSRDGRELLLLKDRNSGRKSILCWYDLGEKTVRHSCFGLDEVPDYRSVVLFRGSLAKVSGVCCPNC